MVNTSSQHMPQDMHLASMKSGHNIRRPFQPRSVNAPSASPKDKKTLKPQMNPLKSRAEAQSKITAASENLPSWSSQVKETRTPTLESESEPATQSSIFRRRPNQRDPEENECEMFALKRANPVYDSDDEEDYMITPPKRQRTTDLSVLHWDDQLSEGEIGSLSFSF